ncbi:PorV/PorQ family protein [bacterium SCSIO 12643]|nr:PorV/PorQ family protein [bacterium SCSIO 12643]
MSIKYNKVRLFTVALALMFVTPGLQAGNKDRIGSSGGEQVKINPWARSGSYSNANSASVVGVEATFLNVSGLAMTKKMDLNFNYSSWLGGSGIGISSFGYGQRLGDYSVVAAGFQSMDFGDIHRTTTDLPDGAGTFNAQYSTFYLSYAREFSNSIYAGVTTKVISEGISNANASAVAFDFGIRYVTGKNENIKFGIALKNIGSQMKFEGDGFSTLTTIDSKVFTVSQRTQGVELPSILNIGLTYDYLIGELSNSDSTGVRAMHRISPAINFMSNSFGKDQISFGIEYAFKEFVMARLGYLYEDQVTDASLSTLAYSGPSGGITVALPVNKTGSTLDIDYGYRATRNFSGTHTIGLRLNL